MKAPRNGQLERFEPQYQSWISYQERPQISRVCFVSLSRKVSLFFVGKQLTQSRCASRGNTQTYLKSAVLQICCICNMFPRICKYSHEDMHCCRYLAHIGCCASRWVSHGKKRKSNSIIVTIDKQQKLVKGGHSSRYLQFFTMEKQHLRAPHEPQNRESILF